MYRCKLYSELELYGTEEENSYISRLKWIKKVSKINLDGY